MTDSKQRILDDFDKLAKRFELAEIRACTSESRRYAFDKQLEVMRMKADFVLRYENPTIPIIAEGKIDVWEEVRDVSVTKEADAHQVLHRLNEIIRKYQIATIFDFCQILDLPTRYAQQKYGWSDLSSAFIRSGSDFGYQFVLPTPTVL